MTVIYLDQNAASLLAKSNPEAIWQKIRKSLVDGFHNGKLICPMPFEGVLETAPRPLKLRQSIQSLFWQVSGGVAFKEFAVMSNELTLGLIRPVPDLNPWSIWEPMWAEMESAAREATSRWKSGKARMTERMNAFVPSLNPELLSQKEVLYRIAEERSSQICDALDSLPEGRLPEHCSNCSGLIQFLVSANLSSVEIEALKRAVMHHEWAKIPIHWFQLLLGAKWEYDFIHGGAASYSPNDEIDGERAAMALSYADLLVTEGDLANLCQKAKINGHCRTLVLSVRNGEKLLETIHSLIGT